MSYSLRSQALSVYTSKIIEGTAPYLTIDNGRTKVTTTEDLLGITLSNGTKITSSTNLSSASNPIVLPNKGETLSDISMLVPPSTNSITLDTLIGAPYNYWGDDDGDGQGANGVTATGILSVTFTDKSDRAVNRSDTLDICSAPYKVTLSTTGGSLTTQYGVPNSSNFSSNSVTYYISPNSSSSCYFVEYVRPNLKYGEDNIKIDGNYYNFAGPLNIWNPNKGFLVQSTDPSFYDLNFPTTGSDGLYFDLDMGEKDTSQLTWASVTHDGITASMVTSPISGMTRVTLTGPRASDSQIKARNPSPLSVPNLPQTFELEGRDSSGTVVAKYGFKLKQWFVNRGDRVTGVNGHTAWCNGLGYRLVQVSDLTNAVRKSSPSISGAMPSSDGNNYQRLIGAGFFTEWGYMQDYIDADFRYDFYVTSVPKGSNQFNVGAARGYIHSVSPGGSDRGGLCVTP
ncbi:hypothetical protein GQ598_10680 [Gilliamella sp. Pas-s95]|nr:hypothetical protein [Gilliamella sp. Pas-s95]